MSGGKYSWPFFCSHSFYKQFLVVILCLCQQTADGLLSQKQGKEWSSTLWIGHPMDKLCWLRVFTRSPSTFIVFQIVNQQFYCVRPTWATYMFTRPEYGAANVERSFDKLNLTTVKAGVAKSNLSLLSKTLVQAFDNVVDSLGAKGLGLVLDDHVSMPIWCCGKNDRFSGVDRWFNYRSSTP